MIDVIIFLLTTFIILMLLYYLFWKIIFLRNPDRKIPEGKNLVSPADGKVITIAHSDDLGLLKIKKGLIGKIRTTAKGIGTKYYLISIFMSPLDVHFNRIPIQGKITSIRHNKGKLLPVNNLKNSLVNENTEMIINSKAGKIKVIQIAGFLARRIETFVKKGQSVKKGQVFGLINLGSQVTLIIPDRFRITIKQNQKVKAGKTIIAQY